MPKSIIDIQVNDSDFKEFSELFDKYQKKVQALPGAWGNVNKEVKSGFEAATAALLAQSEINRRGQDASKESVNSARTVADYWKEAAGSAGIFAGRIMDASRSIIKWTGITSVAGGLLGFGGLWGLDRLAGAVGAGRRASQGLGISTGERVAFGLNYSRVTDTGALLSDVNAALHDPSQLSRLYAAGVYGTQGKDTGQVAVELMDRYKQLADQTSPQMLGAVLKAHGGLISLEDFERLKSLSPQEYGDIRNSYGTDAKTLALQDETQKKWQLLNIQLSRAGLNIENAFVRGLTPLVPGLTKLSGTVSNLVLEFLSWANKFGIIDKIGEELNKFDTYLKSPEFKQDMDALRGNMELLGRDTLAVASKMHDALVYLGVVPETPEEKKKREAADAAAKAAGKTPPKWSQTGAATGAAAGAVLGAPLGVPGIVGGAVVGGLVGGFNQYSTGSLRDQNPELFGPYKDLLPYIAHQESGNTGGFNKDGSVLVSKEGARGLMQIMPATAASLNKQGYAGNPDTPADATYLAAVLLGQLSAHYGGDEEKMLAGYNWGPGDAKHPRLDADIAKHPTDWMKYLPKETAKYIVDIEGAQIRQGSNGSNLTTTQIAAMVAKQTGITVYVYNAPGNNAVVSTGQLAR